MNANAATETALTDYVDRMPARVDAEIIDAISDLAASCARIVHHPQRRLDRAQGERLLLACMQVARYAIDAHAPQCSVSREWLTTWHAMPRSDRRVALLSLAGDKHPLDSLGSRGNVVLNALVAR